MTLSAKSSLILGENKAGFRRESHIFGLLNGFCGLFIAYVGSFSDPVGEVVTHRTAYPVV